MKERLLAFTLAVCVATGAVVALAPRARAAQPVANPAAKRASPGARIVDVKALQKTIKKRQGKTLLLHFWATWCLPCLDELPVMNRFAEEMKPRGLEVVSISLDQASPQGAEKVSAMLREKAPHLTATIVQVPDPNAFINTVDNQWEGNIPAVFVFDQKGEMRGRFVGEASRRQLDDLVGYLLKPVK